MEGVNARWNNILRNPMPMAHVVVWVVFFWFFSRRGLTVHRNLEVRGQWKKLLVWAAVARVGGHVGSWR